MEAWVIRNGRYRPAAHYITENGECFPWYREDHERDRFRYPKNPMFHTDGYEIRLHDKEESDVYTVAIGIQKFYAPNWSLEEVVKLLVLAMMKARDSTFPENSPVSRLWKQVEKIRKEKPLRKPN